MITTATLLLLSIPALLVFQQAILALANFKSGKRRLEPVLNHRRIAVFLFAERMEGNIRQMLLQLIHQEYPADKFRVHLVTSDRNNISQYSDLPVTVLVAYDSTKVGRCRTAIEQIQGVYDIAVSIHQPLRLSEQYLNRINEGFQQGLYFMQPWVSKAESHTEVVPEPEAGFQSLAMSVPLNNAIYSTPFLWLKQQLDQMKDIENYHHGLQYRMLEQGYFFRLVPGTTAVLNEDAIEEKKGIINRLQFGLKGFRLLFAGKPSMLFIGIWKCQPPRIIMICALLAATYLSSMFAILLAVYLLTCAMIMMTHPCFDLKKSFSNISRQAGQLNFGMRRKRTALAVSTGE